MRTLYAQPNNVTVEESFSSVKITIITQKRWGQFALEMFQWVPIVLILSFVAALLLFPMLQSILPERLDFLAWILTGGLILSIVYRTLQKPFEYISDREIIEFDNFAITIEHSNPILKIRRVYLAKNIEKLTTVFSLEERDISRHSLLFIKSTMLTFIIRRNHGLWRYELFGRAVDSENAQSILKTIHKKFPRYKV